MSEYPMCMNCTNYDIPLTDEPCHSCIQVFLASNGKEKPNFKSNKILTNADRIRNMSDEELAELIGDNIDCAICKKEIFNTTECPGSVIFGGENCYVVWHNWLRQEVESNDS